MYYLTEVLSKVLPKKSSLITDSGLIELILPSNMAFKEEQRSIHPKSQGAMGVAECTDFRSESSGCKQRRRYSGDYHGDA